MQQIRTLTLAASFVVAPAAFTASLAQDAAVNEQTFDWIFFAIVGLPLVVALVELLVPALSERLIRSRNRPGD
jgi:hypothetical protein